MARLNVKSVESAAPGNERLEIPDGYMKGLYLIIQPSGAKSWAVRYRHEGRPRKLTIGSYPVFDLKAARDEASKALRAASEGRDPAAKKLVVDSVGAAVAQYIERHLRRNYRPGPMKEAERFLLMHVLSNWRDRKVSEISRADVRNMLERIVVSGTPITANRVHGIVRRLFNWCVEQELIATSPCVGLKRPAGKETPRDRVLGDDELHRVWRAAETLGPPFGAMVQLLILTGQRRNEVAHMEWGEIDLGKRLWALPRERVKNNCRHEVPLSPQATAIIERMPRISERYVFSLNGETPIRGFGRIKDHMDALLPTDIPDWVFHDLRRTVASGMARLGISLAVIEKVLNHTGGSFAGIVGVYQRHEFADEKRAALGKWADHVEALAGAVDYTNS